MCDRSGLSDIMDTVRSRFRNGPPNGWLLGWDECRYLERIRAAASPFQVVNFTSFDYEFCNSYGVETDRRIGSRRWTLVVKLSFVAPFYRLHWTKSKTRNPRSLIGSASGPGLTESAVRSVLDRAGMRELPDGWYEHHLSDIQLELAGTDNVTLGKCLFCDYSG